MYEQLRLNWRSARLITGLACLSAHLASAAFYTNDTDWAGLNLTLQNGDVIAGVHTNIGHFSVAPGATATVHPYGPVLSDPIIVDDVVIGYATTNFCYGRVRIYAASGTLSGTLSANAAGFHAERGDGAGTDRSGGSYGGRGGIGTMGRITDTYGLPGAPDRLGSGAGLGHALSTGGAGGGALFLEVTGTLAVDGALTACGQDGTYRAGGGSGGSIWLRAATLDGDGLVAADGGTGAVGGGGGGGGGRIAFDTPQNMFAGTLRARGGLGGGDQGRHGTFNFQSDSARDLTITADIALPPGTNWAFRSLTVPTNVVFQIQATPGTSPAYTDERASRVRILNDVTVAPGGVLSADGTGYLGQQGAGASAYRSGASHGGRGGAGSIGAVGEVYGTVNAPIRLGSGGGFGHTLSGGGSGGGAWILDVGGTLTVDGILTAGGISGYYRTGGGSGGSIWLTADTLAGQGLIAADGGHGSTDGGGGGGGGRIAFDTPQNQFSGTIRARGGTGTTRGRHGTFAFLSDPRLDLTISADIALPPGTNWVFRSLTVPTNVVLEIQSTSGTAPGYANESASRVRILTDMRVAAGGGLSADGLGYAKKLGPGAGTEYSGAGYGGDGGQGPEGVPGAAYGSADAPDRLGSSGGLDHNYSGGATGGGVLMLEVGETLTVDGTLSACGGNGYYRAGGGSGGSIWVKAAEIAGAGRIGADGGAGVGGGGGGGGGGRILLDYGWIEGYARRPGQVVAVLNPPSLPATLVFHGQVTTAGGSAAVSYEPGAAGSRMYRYLPITMGLLIIVR